MGVGGTKAMKDITKINKFALDVALESQAEWYERAGEEAADAVALEDIAKQDMDYLAAGLNIDIRNEPSAFGLKRLSEEAIKEIVNLRMKVVKDRLLVKGINFKITDEALSYLAKEGYDPHYGARPLNRLIQNKILNHIASDIISNTVKKGDTVFVSVKNKELLIENKKKASNPKRKKIKSPIRVRSRSSSKV